MDIRAVYDSARRMTEWLDSDITTFTIRHAIAFAIVWWLSRGFFRAAQHQAQQTAPDPVARCMFRDGTLCWGQTANCDAPIADCGARVA